MKRNTLLLLALIPIIPFVIIKSLGLNIPAVLFTLNFQLQTGLHGFYGLGLLTSETLNSHPVTTYVKLGYWRALKFKFIYLMRFLNQDNFLYQDWLQQLHSEWLAELEASNAPKDDEAVFQIPSFDYATMDPRHFLEEFVNKGRPAILKNANIAAMKWTPDNLAERFPDFVAKTRCLKGYVGPRTWTLKEYVDSRNASDVTCYLDNNAELFEQYPELVQEMEIYKVAEHMTGEKGVPPGQFPKTYLFSQIFLSVHQSTGALYHCANYNNLFYMIHGSKKWTFVDPSNSFMLYPMYNDLMRDSKSYLTWYATHAPNSSEIINKHFPLYRYCPKYTAILEKGDLLINPPWNWHMVENIGSDSIGVASRWTMTTAYPYTNVLFSFQQFLSKAFYVFLYRKALSKITGVPFNYNATSHLNLDEQLNFGRIGSTLQDPRRFDYVAPSMLEKYYQYLESIGYKN